MPNPILPRATDELPRYDDPHGNTDEGMGAASVVEHFSHLVIGVTDLDRSEVWYRDVIGLDLVGRDLTAEERPHSILATNTGQLFILVVDQDFVRPARNGRHQALLVTPNAYRRAYDRLEKMGYKISDTHEGHRALGNYSIDIMDPDGHRYQIQTYGPEAHEFQGKDVGTVDCGPASSYRVGGAKAFKKGDFYVVRLPEGFLAVSRWCMHMNGRVVYQGKHYQFYCPFHDATYDRHGVPHPYPGNRAGGCGPLRTYPISFGEEGHVLVDTAYPTEREDWDASQAVAPPVEAEAVA